MSGHGGGRLIAAKTDFESMSHEQMHALLQSADIHAAGNLSAKLAAIHKTVETIGNHLKAHVMGLTWEGKGGDAFREWGNQTANATLKLSAYADAASKQMNEVSQAIVEAHANMPDLSRTTGPQADLHKATQAMKHSDSPALDMTAIRANSRIEATRSDAAATMQKLATTYVDRGGQINALKPPTFPPPASQLGKTWQDTEAHRTVSGEEGGLRNSSVSGGTDTHGSRADSRSVSGSLRASKTSIVGLSNSPASGGAHSISQQTPFAPDTHMEVDSAGSSLAGPSSSVSAPPPAHHSSQQGFATSVPPAFGGRPSGVPYAGSGGGPFGRQLPLSGGPLPRVTGNEVTGERVSLPRESGIVGGKPVESPNGRVPARLPRGMVVGGEQAPNGTGNRPPLGGRGSSGLHMGSEGQTAAGRNGLVGGRRLASEPGGVVGRPTQSEKLGARPFTQGGSGLARAGSEETEGREPGQGGRSGTLPRGGRSRARHRDDERGSERPDYLTEEEETWQQGNRRVVPPVIE
ncbi:WXG100 family type VII secretion target [Streptomyces sp. 8L]|uniref:WXG100 family type VII secretion target n=1 Tax=Streptomyces sp. 8L TaxID=2877242 RepID=UPI001CD34330|nr:WXG100 family type VII secretion target [Streptomyces sp. 8L]MCA1222919.1 WXG100 family type VII secretion target [Streptomyces sp. 8L]